MFKIDLKGTHIGEMLQRTPTESSTILKNGLIFGIVDSELDEKLGVPLFACLVEPSSFLQAGG